MSIKEVALSLNSLSKKVATMPESALKLQLQKQINIITEILLANRIQSNEARNFQLTPLELENHTDSKTKPKNRKPKKG